MSSTLPSVAHEHHQRLMAHVDEMPVTADMLLTASLEEVQPRLDATDDWLNGMLLPHLAAAEANIHPQLEQLMQNRHSMEPMRREHEQIRQLTAELGRLRAQLSHGHMSKGQGVAIRRVLFQLYALLKIHLVEEECYIKVIEHDVDHDAVEMMASAMDHPVTIRG
jgi:hypothetical protein